MRDPTNGDGVHQIIYSLNLMRNSIPKFTKVVAQAKDLLENVYQMTGKRLSRAVNWLYLNAKNHAKINFIFTYRFKIRFFPN